MFKQSKEVFSIRKTIIGVGSVLIGSLVFSQGVQADEVVSTNSLSTTDSLVAAQAVSEPIAEAAEANPSVTASLTTVTAPMVEEKTLPAVTEYVADETMEAGTSQVVTEAKYGSQTTTTTYKEVETVVDIVEQSAKDSMASTDYKYGASDFYHIDETQTKPSDKIVIDKVFADTLTPITEDQIKTDTSIRDIVTSVETNYGLSNQTARHALLALTSNDGSQPTIYLSTEHINPESSDFQNLLTDYSFLGTAVENRGTWTGVMSGELKQAIYYELLNKSSANLTNLASFSDVNSLVPSDNTEENAIKAYHASLLPISDELYADAKADYERYLLALTKVNVKAQIPRGVTFDPVSQEPKTVYETNPIMLGGDAFETITQRYNLSKNQSSLKISYDETTMPVEKRDELESQIEKLPAALKNSLLKLDISDEGFIAAETNNAVGLNNYFSANISLKYLSTSDSYHVLSSDGTDKIITFTYKPIIAMMDVLTHEISHTIDRRSGAVLFDNYKYYRDAPSENIVSVGRLSHTNEFIKVFEEYFLNNEDVAPYYRYSPTEAFAEGFGEYINHRIYGASYTRYLKVGDNVYSYNPDNSGLNSDYDAMYETVYVNGYSPVEATEWYWEALYQKLFESAVTTEVVVDTITKTETPAQNGLVRVGTKPVVTVETIAYQTIEESDVEQPVGYRVVKQQGQDGQVQTITTYTLVSSTTGKVTSETKTVTIDPVNEIIVIGTKKVTESSVQEQPKLSPGTPVYVSTPVSGSVDKDVNVNKPGRSTDADLNYSGLFKGSEQVVKGTSSQVGVIVTLTGVTYSRVAKAQAASLPQTGGKDSLLASLAGVMMLSLGFGLSGKRRKYN
ncbi:G5 domain-containing protein [Streptococcus thoraltensis]|uniref:G5 domain-containing protein n=1 Tax=Streptococcus thoraltensis TaxID=55085 RepID=UPI001F5A4F0C|nr:G5 domain-containing protein [Streptococcus thoraltensis]